jgi:hypothetical protein
VKNVLLVILAVCVIVLAVLYVKSRGLAVVPATRAKKNNLTDIDCNLHGGNKRTAITANYNDGISYSDEAVFVCTGEKLRWEAGTGVTHLDVYFPSAQEWPFSDPFVAKLSADPQNPTPDLTVTDPPAGYRVKAFKYSIDVSTQSGNIPRLDPHVIPMGP